MERQEKHLPPEIHDPIDAAAREVRQKQALARKEKNDIQARHFQQLLAEQSERHATELRRLNEEVKRLHERLKAVLDRRSTQQGPAKGIDFAFVRRAEWQLNNCKRDVRSVERGQSIWSDPFAASCISELQLEFFPQGPRTCPPHLWLANPRLKHIPDDLPQTAEPCTSPAVSMQRAGVAPGLGAPLVRGPGLQRCQAQAACASVLPSFGDRRRCRGVAACSQDDGGGV
eukprot:g26964.t1